MGYKDSVRYPHLQDMISSYWYADSFVEPLWETIERVKADSPADYAKAIRGDIVSFLGSAPGDLDAEFRAEFVSYYWPHGDGLTAREWLSRIDAMLAAPPDASRDQRSGAFGQY